MGLVEPIIPQKPKSFFEIKVAYLTDYLLFLEILLLKYVFEQVCCYVMSLLKPNYF